MMRLSCFNKKNNKRAQFFEMAFLVMGIILLATVFITVLSVRSSIPSNPNLAAKTVMLSEKSFDTISLYFTESVASVANSNHLDLSSLKLSCSNIQVNDVESALNSFTIFDYNCAYPTLEDSYEKELSSKIDLMFENIDARSTYAGFAVHPKSFVFDNLQSKFISGQFSTQIIQDENGVSSLVAISRRPLTVSASTPNVAGTDKLWMFNAERDLMTKAPLSKKDSDLLRLFKESSSIRESAIVPILSLVNSNEKNYVPSDSERELLVSQIDAQIRQQVTLSYLSPLSQINSQDYLSYIIISDRDVFYLVFPNLGAALQIYDFKMS